LQRKRIEPPRTGLASAGNPGQHRDFAFLHAFERGDRVDDRRVRAAAHNGLET
jgi:hypothetical protein